MPIHDWTRVSAGTFHHFHSTWITHLSDALNAGVLPEDCYAMAEQTILQMGPDVLTLQTNGQPGTSPSASPNSPSGPCVCTLTAAPPRVRLTMETEADSFTRKQRHVVIRHSSDDRILAIIEIVSPGNKNNRNGIRAFTDKVLAALSANIHLLIIDLFPPSVRDPQGIHGVLWQEIDDTQPWAQPLDKPLTVVSYRRGLVQSAYIEPVAVGDALIDMPLFLDPDGYVNVPLESTYQRAYQGVPRRWRQVLEGAAGA